MNRLSQEKSPYLLQHQHNPVHWWAWCDQAIEEAQRQDKPLFVSIGYSTCYWCHVMERESFEDQQVADFLNEHFICIKVDREERPDIDAIYMEAAVAITGQGGWPLSAFLDVDLKPFFAGSYFPKQQFLEVLQKLVEAWSSNREQIKLAGSQLYEVLQVTTRSTKAHELPVELWEQAYSRIRESFDSQNGGFGQTPKFPASGTLRFLLRYYRRFNDEEALLMAKLTLAQMARGGLYDQVGGGFHRYSTDAEWLIPHFEKMLYDTAMLVPAYLECWQLTGEDYCREIARESLDYILLEMRSEQGGFFSAQDAGEVGREGEFYVWSEAELIDLLSPVELDLLCETFQVLAAGNFESGMTILRLREGVGWEQRYSAEMQAVCAKLSELRSTRRYPHLDDKVVTSWNALMISALCKGYQVLGSEKYLAAAQQAAGFIHSKLYQNGQLFRRFRDEEIRYPAFLEDYAFSIQALLDLYQTDSDLRWFTWAQELQVGLDSLFWDAEQGGYFASSALDPTVIVRKKEHSDTSLPSASAVSAANLFRFACFTGESSYRERGNAALAAYSGFLTQYPDSFAYSYLALEFEHFGPLEIVITDAPNSQLAIETKKLVFEQFQPTLVLACGKESQPSILAKRQKNSVYVCAQGSCSAPIADAESAMRELRERFT